MCYERTTTHLVNEVLNSIRRQTRIKRELIASELNLIPLANGIYDFHKNELKAYSSEHIFLKKHPILYSTQKIEINPINKFLLEITGKEEDFILLKQIIGYCFYRSYLFQEIIILVGKGANGKSVLLNLIRAMLGQENVSNQSLQSLTENRFAIASLYGKNVNMFGDLPAKAYTDVGTLKQLSGGDTITAEQKFKNPFDFCNYAKIIASCNEAPESPDDSDGFFRRCTTIVFPHKFEGKKDNKNLINELVKPEYLSDFFNQCIDSFKQALQENSFIRKETTEQKKERYLNYSNSTAAFCLNFLEYEPESEIRTENIYSKYKQFCKDNELPSKDDRVFFQKLYKYFGHKAWKKRINVAGTRHYVIAGLEWKEPKKVMEDTKNQINPIDDYNYSGKCFGCREIKNLNEKGLCKNCMGKPKMMPNESNESNHFPSLEKKIEYKDKVEKRVD